MSDHHESPRIIEPEFIPPSAIESVSRAEVDVQISTAHRFPRNLPAVKKDMMAFATLDQETAESCFYTLPRGGKSIQGPSIRMAEIAASCYGNMRCGTRVVETVANGDSPYVIIQGVAHDLEKNLAVTIEKRRRITKKKHKDAPDEDDVNLAVNACSAIAFRDAVFKVVPGALTKAVWEAAKRVAIGDASTLADRRSKAFDYFAKMGVTKERVLGLLKKTNIEEVSLDDLEVLTGLRTAIKDGQTTIDEQFPLNPKPAVSSAPPVDDVPMDFPEKAAAATTPTPAPKAAKTKTAAKAPEPTPTQVNPMAQLEDLCVEHGVTDEEMCWFIFDRKLAKGVTTLRELSNKAPAQVAELVKNFASVRDAIVAKRAEGAAPEGSEEGEVLL